MSITNIKDNIVEGIIFYPSTNCDKRPDDEELTLIVVHAISVPPGKTGGNEIEDFVHDIDNFYIIHYT